MDPGCSCKEDSKVALLLYYKKLTKELKIYEICSFQKENVKESRSNKRA